MDRRSFILSLIGGVAAASVGAVAMSQAAQRPDIEPIAPKPVDQVAARSLDETDAEFSQYYRRRPGHHGRMMHRRRMNMRRARRMDRRARPNSQR